MVKLVLHQAETSNDELYHNRNSSPFYRNCKVNIEHNKKANKCTCPYQLNSSLIKAILVYTIFS